MPVSRIIVDFSKKPGCIPDHKEFAMRKVKFALSALLLAVAATTGLAFANLPMPEEPGGAICGAWEWTGGTSFQRLCIEGSLHWYEYRTIKP